MRLPDADQLCWSVAISPGSRTRDFHARQVLRPRGTIGALAVTHVNILPSSNPSPSASRLDQTFAARWLACVFSLPTLHNVLAERHARLGAGAACWAFTTMDFHQLVSCRLSGAQGCSEVGTIVLLSVIPSGAKRSRGTNHQGSRLRRSVDVDGPPPRCAIGAVPRHSDCALCSG